MHRITFPRKHWREEFVDVTEIRSQPWLVWLIDHWLLWAHEWPWLISPRLMTLRIMRPFCTAYDVYVFPWANRFEQIDRSIQHHTH